MSRFMELITSGVKYSMFFFNVLFVITGIIILSIGVAIQAEYHAYKEVLSESFFSLPTFLIVIGSFIFIIAFFGCCGALKENYFMILAFSILMVLIFIFELAAGISGYVLKGRVETLLTTSMYDSMKVYNGSVPIQIFWDGMQQDWDCCGTKSYSDWEGNITNGIPISCCNITGAVGNFTCNFENVSLHKNGCLNQLTEWASAHAGTIGAAGLILALIQILAIVFSCHLARRTKYETMA